MVEVAGGAPGRRGTRNLFPIGFSGLLDGALRSRAGWRRFLRRHPETFALLAALLAWPITVLLHGAAGHGVGTGGPPDTAAPDGTVDVHLGHAGHAGHGAGAPTVEMAMSPLDLLVWAVMVVAMMVPLVWPAVRHVGVNSLRWRRQRAIVVFLAGYVAVWTAFGAVVLLVQDLLPVPSVPALAAALAVAALWQLSPQQRRFRWACHRTVPLPPRGLPAAASDLRFGLRQGLACVGVCWPLMLAMAWAMVMAPGAMVLWMLVLTAAMACAKLLPRSRQPSRPLAAGLGAAAGLVLLTTVV